MVTITLSSHKFPLGQIVTTSNAQATLLPEEISESLQRHSEGDWGDLCEHDIQQNELGLEQSCRLFSAYGAGARRFWIITEWDRSVTTVLLPQDY